ncbi:hypothetical protein [Streptomyces boncukensis]|uniref:hypothetical protein n=1 Tax=Streptomyces boncukensis TaxID=2711219 RepID=UPI0019D26AE1|nr:hypothetical protein [Streptomyces boncukensis]
MTRTRFHVGFNEIGLAPEYRIECFGDLGGAREWLAADVANVAEDVEDAREFDAFLDRLDALAETDLVGTHRVDAFEFWIRRTEGCTCPCDCAERGVDCDGEHRREAAPVPADNTVEFFPVAVTELPDDEDHAPLLVDPVAARIVRAAQVCDGDTVLASFETPRDRMPVADYFNDQYTARPKSYDPTCGCGSCATMADHEGPFVNLGDDNPWEVCDPWPAVDLVLVVPARQLA